MQPYNQAKVLVKRRELESQLDAHSERFNKVLQAAKEQAAGAGESDLRRLKRQFASLKNTYMLYDTKEHFLDGDLSASEAFPRQLVPGCIASVLRRPVCAVQAC